MTDFKDPRIDDQRQLIQRVEKSGGAAQGPKRNAPKDKSAFKKRLEGKGEKGESSGKSSKAGSLFDLAASAGKTKSSTDKGDQQQQEPGIGTLKSKGEKTAGPLDMAKVEKDALGELAAAKAASKDAPAVNEMAAAAPVTTDAVAGAKGAGGQTNANVDMKAIARNITEQIVVQTRGELTDTMVTLKHPPGFEGATLRLTETASAKGEFNLTFSNLSTAAKGLVDNTANQAVLREALSAKGIPLHNINSSSSSDNAVASADDPRERQQREGGFDEQSSHHQGDQFEQEEQQA